MSELVVFISWRSGKLDEIIKFLKIRKYDFVIIGGGLVGCVVVIVVVEKGLKVVLIYDCFVLGGNVSSEICVYILGIYGKFECIFK